MEKESPEIPLEPTRVKMTITLPPHLIEDAKPRLKLLEYGGFSAYVEQLIWQDLRDRPAHVRVREEPTSLEPTQEHHEKPANYDTKKPEPPDKTDKRIGFERKEHGGFAMPLSFIAGVDALSALLQK
jgi:hypothetical protein